MYETKSDFEYQQRWFIITNLEDILKNTSFESFLLQLRDKKEILSKIDNLEVIKKNWWFEKYCRENSIKLIDIMKDNKLINEIYEKVKNNI